MSNRLLGFFILISIVGVGYLLYWYIFIYSLVHVTFESNLEKYHVSLIAKQKNISQDCEQKVCYISDIIKLDYELIAQKDGYKDFVLPIQPKRGNNSFQLIFEKKYELQLDTSVENNKNKATVEKREKDLSIEEKIEEIKNKRDIYHSVHIGNNYYTFRKRGEKLLLSKNDGEIGLFPLGDKSTLDILEIEGSDNFLVLRIEDKNYFFSIRSGKFQIFDFNIPLLYIKQSDNSGEYIFVTSKGSFLYEYAKNTFTYNTLFSDYVVYKKNSYVGVIDKNDSEKKQFFQLDRKREQNVIIQYNTETKEKVILLETGGDIKRLGKKEGRIYIINQTGERYFLSHLQE
ncbi:MAG: hypothetical protein GY828_02250 [Candidatus Gracilibacteria bacterium]|nr:hypothetical protein [Candidatus Gracilibacteria bacterium]